MADRMSALRLFVRLARTANISRAAPEWCSEGLLAIFFLILGLEIRREMTGGSLASWKSTSTPVVAARSRVVISCHRGAATLSLSCKHPRCTRISGRIRSIKVPPFASDGPDLIGRHGGSRIAQATLRTVVAKNRANPRISAINSNVRVSIRPQVKTKSRIPSPSIVSSRTKACAAILRSRGGDEGASASVTTASPP